MDLEPKPEGKLLFPMGTVNLSLQLSAPPKIIVLKADATGKVIEEFTEEYRAIERFRELANEMADEMSRGHEQGKKICEKLLPEILQALDKQNESKTR